MSCVHNGFRWRKPDHTVDGFGLSLGSEAIMDHINSWFMQNRLRTGDFGPVVRCFNIPSTYCMI